jgi:hypothetical protein
VILIEGVEDVITKNEFITMSLDLNLFFLRIMKEHSFFLQVSFTPKDRQLAQEASNFRMSFEKLLTEAVNLANGNVSRNALESRQFATQYTIDAERLTNFYTGVPFNTELTRRELALMPGAGNANIENAVDSLDRRAYRMTQSLVEYKERVLNSVLSCKLFTMNYPLLIEHIIREGRLFMQMLSGLIERREIMEPKNLIDLEAFWNRQMAEHAKFIAGLLDPTEDSLIQTARMFGTEFDKLTAEAREATQKTLEIPEVTKDSIEATERLKEFKTAGTEGLIQCKIKSIIVPLLADHVLREVNHYLCVMGVCK